MARRPGLIYYLQLGYHAEDYWPGHQFLVRSSHRAGYKLKGIYTTISKESGAVKEAIIIHGALINSRTEKFIPRVAPTCVTRSA